MIETASYLTFVAACVAILLVPGPTVTVIIANSLRTGVAAGLMNVVGTQVGLAMMLAVLAAGLTTVVATMGAVFDVVRLVGALYLIWLGIKLWRSDGRLVENTGKGGGRQSLAGFGWQGFLVVWANPKALLFFGAFIPQFVDPGGDTMAQVLILGLTFMVLATVLDGAYAVGAGKMGAMLARHRVRLIERVSGSFLIGGGLWLALARR